MRPVVLGVAGGSGSGKSTVARAILEAARPERIAFLAQDNYYRDFERSGPDALRRQNFDHPDAFDIERFAEKRGRHRFQYLPFGAGPRTCVGAQFATTEALTILAHWLGRWRFVDIGHPAEAAGMVTLRPKGGLPLKLEARQ